MNYSGDKILVTGATGFVGRAVLNGLLNAGSRVVAAVRNANIKTESMYNSGAISWIAVGNIDGRTCWKHAVADVKTVVHCAARAHVMRDQSADARLAYHEVNVDGTLQLAQEASAAGVERFVFLSSIKVNGESTLIGQPFTESSLIIPQDGYGQSKAEAERCLMVLGKETGMEIVIIRLPLVVGPGVKGNLGNLLRFVEHGIPLPLGAVNNQRSLISLDNLVGFVVLCSERDKSPNASNQVFLVSDGEDVSTTTLLRKAAQASGRTSRLLPVPVTLLRAAATVFGKRAIAIRLLGNLQIDATKAYRLLGWRPLITLDAQLSSMYNPSNIV
jgi:nucleoside-diphosphate-sugar epimerase